jgi:soluble lytic murein transglycosylase-like protein
MTATMTHDVATLLSEQLPDLADLATALADAARGWLDPPVTDPAMADAARVSYAETCNGLLEALGDWFVRGAELVGVEDAAAALRDCATILDELAAGGAAEQPSVR